MWQSSRHEAGYETIHSPPETIVGTQSPGERYGWAGCPAQCSRSRAIAVEDEAHLLDRVHRAAFVPRSLRDAGMAGAALDGDRRQQAAATA